MAKEPENKKAAQTAEQPEQETPNGENVTLSQEEFNQVKEHIDKLEAERDEMKLLAQRVQADFDNFRRRNASIHADSNDEGARNVIKELLPVLDNFDRALGNSDGVDTAWLAGIQLVYKQLKDTLAKLGMEEIDASGKFDPELHNAVMQDEAEGVESGMITEVFQKGYKVKNRIIRHSMVKVAK
ncbi:MAG: nucleotide exchange factor GrpE [Clostridia bacterium]|nr:nucleotide exchange factor GrpE [Clostridia bacterium]